MDMNRRELLGGLGSSLVTTKLFRGTTDAPAVRPFDRNPRSAAVLPVKGDFPITRTRTYLNSGRWHPMSIHSMRAIQGYLELKAQGQKIPNSPIGDEMEHEVKGRFASLINASLSEISFVPSTMVGENLVVAGLGIPGTKGNVVTDALHFDGSLYMYRSLEKQGLELRVVLPTSQWSIDIKDLERKIDRNTKLVAVSLVSYVNGFRHDLKALCELAHSYGAYVYADIVQAAGAVPLDVHASGVDFCSCASFKWLMGDFGLGFFYVREDLLDRVIKRTQYGYRQTGNYQEHMLPYEPRGNWLASWDDVPGAAGHFEVGTISYTTVACLTHSLKFIQDVGVENIQSHSQSLIQRLQKEIPKRGFQPLTPPGTQSPLVAFAVEHPSEVASRVFKANIDVTISDNRIRISPSVFNDQEDINKLLNALG